MNPGYLASVLLAISVIFLLSGWREIFMRSISGRDILLFFMFALPAALMTFSVEGAQINGTVPVAFCAALLIGIRKKSRWEGGHLFATGLLLGAVHLLMLELYSVDPVMIVLKPEWDIPVVLAVLVMGMHRGAAEQYVSLTVAMIAGDLSFACMHGGTMPVHLGTPSFLDKWWLSYFTARLLTVFLESVYSGCRTTARQWIQRKRGWRK
ncbi:hypothetical protein ACFVVQ_01110 [Paenibacillus chitinolyticus]|uniref:YphA family membrane protein n=1 Tax=Paenibacillus chitinolyticus TaxID=79263 RepID=UPI0036D9AEA7